MSYRWALNSGVRDAGRPGAGYSVKILSLLSKCQQACWIRFKYLFLRKIISSNWRGILCKKAAGHAEMGHVACAQLANAAAFAKAFKLHRMLLVGGDGISVNALL